MIRMVLIYAALFTVAAGAIWLKPTSNGAGDVAGLDDQDFANMTQLVLTDLGADGLTQVQVSRTLASSHRPVRRPVRAPLDADLSAQLLAEIEAAGGSSTQRRELASLVLRALEEDATGDQIQQLIAEGDGAVDLAPLLEVPGSLAGSDGTRVLASALLRRQAQQGEATESGLTGITGVTTLSVSPSPVDETRTYTVKAGDSLASIADDIYGSPNAYREIFDANRDTLTTIDSIRVGQQLRLP